MRTNGNGHRHDHRDVAEIERELELTRARIDSRTRELQLRLSPGELLDQALEKLRSSRGREFFSNLGRTATENPVPVTLSAVALGWLALASRRPVRYDVDDTGESVAHKAGELAHRAGDRVRSAGHDIAEKGRELGGRLRAGQDRMQDSWRRLTNEQPIVLGLLAIAGGALLAASLPPSETEDELLGGASDELKRKAAERGREELEEVRTRVSEGPEAPVSPGAPAAPTAASRSFPGEARGTESRPGGTSQERGRSGRTGGQSGAG